jgi:nitrite reductase/ring-hydroxylating ferredoxin subunit
MPKELIACQLAELEAGEMRRVDRDGGPPVALFNVDGAVYATDDICTHGRSSLTDEGTLEGSVIECGWHRGTFDVRSGRALTSPCQEPLRSYPIEIRDGEIVVLLPDEG